jgi:hypothetical protein
VEVGCRIGSVISGGLGDEIGIAMHLIVDMAVYKYRVKRMKERNSGRSRIRFLG